MLVCFQIPRRRILTFITGTWHKFNIVMELPLLAMCKFEMIKFHKIGKFSHFMFGQSPVEYRDFGQILEQLQKFVNNSIFTGISSNVLCNMIIFQAIKIYKASDVCLIAVASGHQYIYGGI